MAGMGLRHLLCVGAATIALASCGSGTSGNVAQNGQAGAKPVPGAPPARALPQLRVELANGACQLAWNGAPVNGQGLLDAAVRELEGAIQRAGGPAAMTGNMLTAAVALRATATR